MVALNSFRTASPITILVFILTSCISTSYHGSRKSPVHLSGSDKILIPYLPESAMKESREPLDAHFKKYGLKSYYGDVENLSLTAADLNLAPDQAYLQRVSSQGFNYILIIVEKDKVTGESFYHKSAAEVANPDPYTSSTPESMKNIGSVDLLLYSLQSNSTLYSLTAVTSISPLQWQGKNGGENYVNLGSAEGAVWIAIKKGTKKMLKRCTK